MNKCFVRPSGLFPPGVRTCRLLQNMHHRQDTVHNTIDDGCLDYAKKRRRESHDGVVVFMVSCAISIALASLR